MQVLRTREERGRIIAEKSNQIVRLDERFYRVTSQSGNGMYDVTKRKVGGWLCTCPDFEFRNVQCKHVWAVQFSLAVRKEVEARVIEPITDIHACLFCKSENIIRWGLRHNKYGDIQKFSCKSCGKFFTINLGFEKMKHSPQAITTAMQLYFSGESLRNTARSLRLIGAQVSHQTIYRWIAKYTTLMEKYLDKITPQVSDTWATDELFLKIKGNMKYLYAMMDEQTRFWIAQEVADTKYTADVRPLFQLAKQIAGKQPKTLVSDGAANFHEAYLKEFRTAKLENRTEHIRHIRLAGDYNNNKMERMNGEIRDREKVMRGLEIKDSPILKGVQIYHNFVKPHMALDNRTPAQAAGIEVKGKDKWLTIIQNASQEKT
ncbi:MAG: DDE-type integrase/transposase/recombinase [Candidatus Bathyarchaeia archaeon]